jgi:hypothetical protein
MFALPLAAECRFHEALCVGPVPRCWPWPAAWPAASRTQPFIPLALSTASRSAGQLATQVGQHLSGAGVIRETLSPKLPSLTFTQIGVVSQRSKSRGLKDLPVEMPTHHCGDSSTRPARSSLPSPLKSPNCTSTQVTVGSLVVHRLVLKADRDGFELADVENR